MTAKAKPSGSASPEAALHPSRALQPQVQRVNEIRVARGFWPKITAVASRVPFAGEALAAFFAARDPETPTAAKGIMLGALAYFVLPIDAIPDILVGIGFTDDAAVIAALLAAVGSSIKPKHRQRAAEALDRLRNR